MKPCNFDIKDISQDPLVNIMLELTRSAVLERDPIIPNYIDIDWDKLMDLASSHGLIAWVWDGICKLPLEQQPSRIQRINWGLSAQEIWSTYDYQKSVIKEIIDVCGQNDMRVLLLKGIGLSEIYPNPPSRPSGDIDIYLFGDFEKGNKILANDNYVFTNKHATFVYKGVKIENHQNFFYHGTRLQIDVDHYLFSASLESRMSKDGYFVLPKESGLVHLLLHTMVHINNPEEPVAFKNLVDLACYLYFNIDKLDPKQCGRAMRKLRLEKAFDLYLQVSEWVLSIDLSQYRNELLSKSKDLDNVISLLLNDTLRCPLFDNHSFAMQLKQRLSYYHNTKWRYNYLSNWRTLNRGWLRRQFVYFFKSLVRKPFEK